ncbi:MAG: DUF6498-containing protein [Phycisphaeraceae bacterium]
MEADTASPGWRSRACAGLGVLIANGVPLLGVLALGWSTTEVLLLFWVEVALLVLLVRPARLIVGDWLVGVIAAVLGTLPAAIFLAFHAFFLVGLLYGVDWNNVQGGPMGWSAPSQGSPADWFRQAWTDLPVAGIVLVCLVHVGSLMAEWPTLQRRNMSGQKAPDETNGFGHLFIMHIGIILGGSAILVAGDAIGLLLLLIALKCGYEVTTVLKRRLDAPPRLTKQEAVSINK